MRGYIGLWILCCIAFVINASMVSFFSDQMLHTNLLLLVNAVNIYITLTIYYACCKIDNIPSQNHFLGYTLLLTMFTAVTYLYGMDRLIIIICYTAYQIVLICAVGFVIILKWKLSRAVKFTAFICFVGCGVFFLYYNKLAITGFLPVTTGIQTTGDLPESAGLQIMGFLLPVNFMLTWLYKEKIAREAAVQDEYLHMLTENAADILFHYTLAPYPCFSYISASVEKITGYKQEMFYKDPRLHLSLTHEEDREIIAAAFSHKALADEKNYVRWQRKDGEYIYLEFHNNPIFSEDKLVGIEGILRDITDRKTAEQELIDSKAERQILLSYISHELRTPITYIIGYAEGLKKDIFESEEKKRNAIELIWVKAVFLQKLMEDLFQLSKMETNQFSFEFMQTNVLDLLHVPDEQYDKEFKDKNLSFESQIDEQLTDGHYEVLADVKRIEQVFYNLFHNAIKYTDEEGKIISKCFLDKKKQRVTFQVSNTGKGIPEEEQALIFKQYYRGEHSGKEKDGSGLGLSLSRLIIKAHKGEITVSSDKGRGTTFQFTIPLYAEKG